MQRSYQEGFALFVVPMPLALSAVADVEHHFSLYSKYLEHHVRNAVDELLDNVNILNINNI